MDPLRQALANQYRATLAMLRECVENCPEELWVAGKHPRNTWRIAYHAAFYAHLYLVQRESDFTPYSNHSDELTELEEDADPPVANPLSREEILTYIDQIDAMIEPTLAMLDLETDDPGFYWYKGVPKLEHVILSIRHLATHVGQLEEILDSHGIDFSWITRKK